MLNALSNYLQHLPLLNNDATKETTSTQAVSKSNTSAEADLSADGYAPSTRAVFVSATASDFDVRQLKDQDIGLLQLRLQQYGLISGRDLDAFSVLNTARAELGETETLDAVQLLDNAASSVDERNTPYAERQQISRLHTLLHNLDSARVRH